MLGITCLEITNVYSADTTKEAVVQRPCTLHRRDRRRHACIFTVPREIISRRRRAHGHNSPVPSMSPRRSPSPHT